MKKPLIKSDIIFDEKRSRFIAELIPATNEKQIKSRINELKYEHPKASHVCSAFRIGGLHNMKEGFSDDGEPSGTAGMPMLKTLRHQQLTDCAILITRYFGGIKLGTGGLQRAYSQATAKAISALTKEQTATVTAKQAWFIEAGFHQENELRHLLRNGCHIITSDYQSNGVSLLVDIECEYIPNITKILISRNIHFRKP